MTDSVGKTAQPPSAPTGSLPLDGVRVVAVEHMIAAPYATMLLADFGAEVIKIEPPGTGDKARIQGTIETGPDGVAIGASFMRCNRGKKSVALDVKRPEGRAAFFKLAAKADVVVENMRPGVMDRLGLTYEALKAANPRIVYASFTGYGTDEIYDSPYRDWPAYGPLGEAAAGVTHIRGFEDRPPINSFPMASGDLSTAYMGALGIVMALRQRDATGESQRLDMAMYDCLMSMNETALIVYTMTGRVLGRGRTGTGATGAFPTTDGYVSIVVLDDTEFRRLCLAIGREDLAAETIDVPDPAKQPDSVRGKVLTEAIAAWTSQRTKIEAAEHLVRHKVPAAPVRDAKEVAEDVHVAAREMLPEVEHAAGGTVRVVGNPIKIAGAAPRYGRIPALGENTEEVLASIAEIGEDEIESLRAMGVV